jgi:hypothetical protein
MIIHCKTNNIQTVHKWSEIIQYVKENKVTLMIIDIDRVIISEHFEENTLTAKDLPAELIKLQDEGVKIICLTARPHSFLWKNDIHNNADYTIWTLHSLGIFPHEVCFTNRTNKGLFVNHILLEYSNLKAIFIDNETHQVNNVSKLNNIPLFFISFLLYK